MSDTLLGALIGLGGAVIGVVVAGWVSVQTHRQAMTQVTSEHFRVVLEKLADARIDSIKASHEYKDEKALEMALSVSLNTKCQIYKSALSQILKHERVQVTASELVALGAEYEQDSEFQVAKDCYERALAQASDSTFEKAMILTNLGALLLRSAPLHDRDAGERHFREAVEAMHGRQDDYSGFVTGYIYERWAWSLLHARYPAWREKLSIAREHYEAMPSSDPGRQSALDNLDEGLRHVEHGDSVPTPQPRPPAHNATRGTGNLPD